MTKFFKLFDRLEQNFHLGQATIIIAGLTLLSRVLGFLRDLLLASRLGLSAQSDIYFTAFRIPDTVYNLLILGTLSAAFIPIFTQYYIKDKKEAWRIASSILNISLLTMGGLAFVIFLAAEPLTKLIAPGFSIDQLKQTVQLTRILLLSPIIFTASSVFSSALLSLKKFIWVNTAPLFYNLGIIIGIIWLFPRYGLIGLAGGVLLGALMHAGIQLPQIIIQGFRWKPVLMLHNKGVRNILKLFIPRILGLDISYINLVIVSIIGSKLATGTIAAFNFAANIQAVPLGIFALSTSLAVFPILSEHFAKNEHKAFLTTFNRAFIRVLFFILPSSILLLLMRAQIVRLLIGYGKCDWTCTITTFDTLGILSFALLAQGLIPLLSRAFYARHNTAKPVVIGLIAMAINAGLSYWLSFSFGIMGIALGFLIASLMQALLLMLLLRTDLGKEAKDQKYIQSSDQSIITYSSKIALASFLMGISAYGSLYLIARLVNTHTVLGILLQTGFTVAISAVVYLIIAAKLKVPDAAGLVRYLDKTGRFFNVSNIQ